MEDKKTKAAVEGEVAEADAEASRGESVRTELEQNKQGDSDASDEETVHDSSKEDALCSLSTEPFHPVPDRPTR